MTGDAFDPVVEVDSLSMTFPVRGTGGRQTVQAIRNVSFAVPRGGTLALVGESGCGKTTTVRCITGLLRPTAGEVRFEGASLTGLSSRRWMPFRRKIQMIFQKPMASLNRRRTVAEILTMPLRVHRIGDREARRQRIEEVLDAVDLNPSFGNRYPHELSGGQQQRVAIARALVLEPELIVADEPVSSLDVSVQGKVLNLLLELQEERGLSYLIIAHDLGVIERIADRVVVMYLGLVVEEGPAAAVLHNPQHPYTKALIGSVPRLGRRRTERAPLSGEIPSPLAPPSGCAFHPRCPAYLGDICRTRDPDLHTSGDVRVRCHLFGDRHAAPATDAA